MPNSRKLSSHVKSTLEISQKEAVKRYNFQTMTGLGWGKLTVSLNN